MILVIDGLGQGQNFLKVGKIFFFKWGAFNDSSVDDFNRQGKKLPQMGKI